MNDVDDAFPALIVERKTGNEPLHQDGNPLGETLLDFWRWSASDLVSNATRGVLAEYIVATALGIAGGTRVEWHPFDLVSHEGARIEVKSAAYMQSWLQRKASAIAFTIRPTQAPDIETNVADGKLERRADIYIFCVLHHADKGTLDPLDVNQWKFYVVSAAVLNQRFPRQKTLSLKPLLQINPHVAHYQDLAACVTSVWRTLSGTQSC
jgi:hypothetical protein